MARASSACVNGLASRGMCGDAPSPSSAKGALRLPVHGRGGEPEADIAAFALLAFDGELAAGLGGEALDHRQAQAGALADALGGEEGLGGARPGRVVHPLTVVLDGDDD